MENKKPSLAINIRIKGQYKELVKGLTKLKELNLDVEKIEDDK